MDFCTRKHPCGHNCCGITGEHACLPCMFCYRGSTKQTALDTCVVCYTDSLQSKPCIQLACSHIFHFECIQNILMRRWTDPRISFGFMLCPVCKTPIEHTSLNDLLEPIKVLLNEVKSKALTRLEFEGLFKTEAITTPGSSFYKDPTGFAMDRYAYYACSRCGKAYYGGEGRCEHGHSDNYNPEDLVCGACVDISRVQECPKHGKDYIEFKCRYCCSVAVFYCFGTTHFCNSCHSNHNIVTSMSKSDLPQCPAGPVGKKLTGNQCPLGMKHPPTGDEFSLGCGLCNNLKAF